MLSRPAAVANAARRPGGWRAPARSSLVSVVFFSSAPARYLAPSAPMSAHAHDAGADAHQHRSRRPTSGDRPAATHSRSRRRSSARAAGGRGGRGVSPGWVGRTGEVELGRACLQLPFGLFYLRSTTACEHAVRTRASSSWVRRRPCTCICLRRTLAAERGLSPCERGYDIYTRTLCG